MTPDAVLKQTPQVILWFKIYTGFLTFTYLFVVAFSIFLLFGDQSNTDMADAEAFIMGSLLLAVGVVLFVICLLPLVLAPRPWLWTFNLVIICLGMSSACFLPVCVPLLIYWLKPEAKAFYGKV